MLTKDKSILEYKEVLNDLKAKIVLNRSKRVDPVKETIGSYVIFLSFGDGKTRATVCKGTGKTIDTCWKNTTDIMKSKIKGKNINLDWFRVDLIDEWYEYSIEDLDKLVRNSKYFRFGLAFDNFFNIAFLEQEVKGNLLISADKETGINHFDWERINNYIKEKYGLKNNFGENSLETVYTFRTSGYYFDEDGCVELDSLPSRTSQRITDTGNPNEIRSIIEDNSLYLAHQVQPSGQFHYGYSPCFGKSLKSYNILRHAGTIYSMIEAYEITKNEELLQAVELALNYLVTEGVVYLADSSGENRAFVLEQKNNELKLGANSASILALAKYTVVMNDKKYVSLMQDLAEGIDFFQNKEDHSFNHVLNYPDLTLKDKYRIVYYDGEATFALVRLYEIDQNKRWLEIAKSAFHFFISNDYWKYHDHWLSYASFEISKHELIKDIIEFNFKNCAEVLDSCFKKERSQPILLELIMASYQLAEKLGKDSLMQDLLDSLDRDKLSNAIKHRLSVQINNYFFPEVAMYFAEPDKIRNSFYAWESSFRSRIDDNQHNLSGIINYYNQILNV